MRLTWTSAARADLRDIHNYIAPENPEAARRLQQIIRERVGHLAAAPMMGRMGRVRDTRELVLAGTPYVVAYRTVPGEVQILRILHGARDWPGELA